MIKLIFLVFLGILLMGCAASPDVQKLGPDTFLISSQVMFGPNKANSARAEALRSAEEFCLKQGKEVLVDEYRSTGHAMSLTGDSQVRFKCLDKGDRDLKRPTFRQTPDLVIENRITQ